MTPADLVRDVEGWLSDIECSILSAAASRADNIVVVEIGAWKGKSTICMAASLHPKSKLFTVDPFDCSGDAESRADYLRLKGDTPLLEQFKNNLANKGIGEQQVYVLTGKTHQVYTQLPEEIDVLFVDGDHSTEGCYLDYTLLAPRVRSGGIIMFHDYDPERPKLGPTWVVQNFASKDFSEVGVFDSLWTGTRL